MISLRKRELGLLLIGDISLFALALYGSLVLRYLKLPDHYLLSIHFVPFSFLFLLSLLVFFISGLYDNHTSFFKNRLPQTVIRAQTVNAIIAVIFFFLNTSFGIAPKTTLLVYLVISSLAIIFWRLVIFQRLSAPKKQKALLIGEGSEVEELINEVNRNSRYDFEFVRALPHRASSEAVLERTELEKLIADENITVIVADTRNTKSAETLELFFSLTILGPLTFIPFLQMYENIFERIPLSSLRSDWFLDSIIKGTRPIYDTAKRILDLIGALGAGLVFVGLFPFVALATRLEGKGPLFTSQDRMGPNGKTIRVYKIRTMTASDQGVWIGETENKVTKVGAILRKTSIDELPQVWNILKGEMSLIGPRNDIMGLALRADQEIPYYRMRYIIKPGITGWAQTHQLYAPGEINPQSIEAFKTRLAYDLYYVKHRSFLLDINIALRTIKTLLSRFGVKLRI